MNFYKPLFLCLGIIITCRAAAQQDSLLGEDTTTVFSRPLPAAYLDKVSAKADRLEQKLDKRSTKALRQWQKQEARIKNKVAKKDSLKAIALFGNAQQAYQQLEQKLQNKTSLQQYIPGLDTLKSSIKFLQQNPQLLSNAKEAKKKLSDAIAKVNGMEEKFQQAEEIKKFIKERKQLFKEQLGNLGFAKELKKLNKQAYYYFENLNEYKSLLKDHNKAERKALELLSKSKLFNNFMRKNSMLASLFLLPGDPTDPTSQQASLAGLQTRSQVNGLIQQQIAAGGPNAQRQFQQNIESAQSQMNELKNRINQSGGSSSEDEMPERFKANNQKVKNFFRRLEFGTNIQSQKATGFFPVSSDVGVSLGYRLNGRSTAGIGGSYRIGWGQNIRHINITHQGAGIRSFVDYKIKGSWWLTGGYEMNYRSEFRNIDELKEYAWAKSGLTGLSKVVSLKTKFFKKMKLQLMWDWLSYEQVPKTNAVIFRVGYNF